MPHGPVQMQAAVSSVVTADAWAKLAAAATTTIATKLMTGQNLGDQLLGSFIQYGGMAVLSEELSDLIAPRVEALLEPILGPKDAAWQCYVVRAGLAGGYVSGVSMLAGQPFDLRIFGAAALGAVVANYVWSMQMAKFSGSGASY